MGMFPIPGPCQAYEKCPNPQTESLEGFFLSSALGKEGSCALGGRMCHPQDTGDIKVRAQDGAKNSL